MNAPSTIDACAFHEWASIQELGPYMSSGWRDLLLRPGDPAGPNAAISHWRYRSPVDSKAEDTYPETGVAASEAELLIEQLLGDGQRSRVVLGYDDGILATAHANHYIARLMARAANEWTAERWLQEDDRLFGLVLVSTALPDEAAAEIRRAGRNEKMVGVALGANALARPFGHPIYHPIYEAAVELDMPIVLQVGSDAATDLLTKPVAGGLPTTYAEYKALGAQPHMTHVASMIGQGVFELFPSLKVLLVGGGAAWIPAYLWRFDYWFHINGREAPWLQRLPSEYFLEHVLVSTYGLERPPTDEALATALETVPGLERSLVYASCYPNADSEAPDGVARRLPPQWRTHVLAENADRLFRWPGEPRHERRPGITPTAMTDPSAAPEAEPAAAAASEGR